MQVVGLHVTLNRLELETLLQGCKGISLELFILAHLDSLEHHPLEILDDHVLLQTCDAGVLQPSEISLLAELSDQLFIVRELLPSLHYGVHSVKIDDCLSLALSLALVKLPDHRPQISLLA